MKRTFMLVLLCIFLDARATNYYVKKGGNDSNTGLSDAQAWATLTKVNSRTFAPGDSIFFNRGETWVVTQASNSDGLNIKNSGSSSGRIFFGAYGSGAKPIITGRQPVPGWKTAANWTNVSGNIWSMANGCTTNTYTANNRGRLWLNGSEAVKYPSNSIYTPGPTCPWTHNGTTLYLYATTNPASYYTNIESLGPSPVIVYCTGKYITIANLDIRGSGNLFQLSGCDYLIVENCSIGYDSGQSGLITTYGGTASDNVIIRNNIFDTNDHTIDTYEMNNTEDGIIVGDGDDNWDIYGNTFIGWGHTAYNFGPTTVAATNIKFHNNTSTCPYSDYGRAFTYNIQTAVGKGTCTGNEIYNNFFYNHPTHSQISGDGLKFYNNIIDGVRGSTFRTGMSSGLVINAYAGPTDNNQIYNNVIMNANENGLYIVYSTQSTKNNLIKNNLVFNNNLYQFRYEFSANNGASIGHNTIDNNLFYKSGQTNPVYYEKMASLGSRSMTVATFNAQNGTSANLYAGEISDEIMNNMTGDPLLADATNTSYLLRNYHLTAGSLAIGKGVAVPGVLTDYEGKTYGNPPNIGCFATTYSSNKPPVVSITSPTKSSTYTAPATITISANASDPDGTVATVEFFSGSLSLGKISKAPYTIVWNNVAAGIYSLTALATDNLGATANSPAVSVEVQVVTADEPVISDNANKGHLLLYPNPNSGQFSIDLENYRLDEDRTVTVFDLTGKVVYSGSLLYGETNKQFDLTYIPSGLYILKINSRQMTSVSKFCKK